MIELVEAEGERIERHASDVPKLVWSTGPASYEFHFAGRSLFDALVLRSWRTPGTLFAADATTLAIEGNELMGLAITMKGPEFRERQAALGPLWPELMAAGEVDPDGMAEVIKRSRLASWLNPIVHPRSYYVHAIAVKPAARGQRTGLKLMEHAFETAKALGCRDLQLDVLSDNPAVQFYLSLGLEVLAETRAPKPSDFGVPVEYRMGKAL